MGAEPPRPRPPEAPGAPRPRPPVPMGIPFICGGEWAMIPVPTQCACMRACFATLGSIRLNIGACLSMSGTMINLNRQGKVGARCSPYAHT